MSTPRGAISRGETHVLLEGTIDGATIALTAKRIDLTKQPLMSRGFHWISDEPHNY